MNMDERLLSAQETAGILRVSRNTIYRLCGSDTGALTVRGVPIL